MNRLARMLWFAFQYGDGSFVGNVFLIFDYKTLEIDKGTGFLHNSPVV